MSSIATQLLLGEVLTPVQRAHHFALARIALYLYHIGSYQLACLFALDPIDSDSISYYFVATRSDLFVVQ